MPIKLSSLNAVQIPVVKKHTEIFLKDQEHERGQTDGIRVLVWFESLTQEGDNLNLSYAGVINKPHCPWNNQSVADIASDGKFTRHYTAQSFREYEEKGDLVHSTE